MLASESDGSEKIPRIVTMATNPVTKSVVFISPPVEITDEEDLLEVGRLFIQRCEEAWHNGQDLRCIEDLRGWARAS